MFRIVLWIACWGLWGAVQAQESSLAALIGDYSGQATPPAGTAKALIAALEKNMLADPGGTAAHLEGLLQVARKRKDADTEVNLARLRGAAFFYGGKFSEAEEAAEKAYRLAQQYTVRTQMPRILATKGNALIMQSRLPEALEAQNKGLKIAEELQDQPVIHLIKNNLVAIYLQLNDFDLAKSHLEDNIRFYSKNPAMVQVLATNYNNLALVYEKQKDYRRSVSYLRLALAQRGVEANKTLLSQIYNNLGSGYSKQNRIDSAFYYFSKAYEVSSETKNAKSQAVSKIGLSEYYLKTRQYGEAQRLASEAYQAGKEVNSMEVQKESAEQLMKIYSHLHRPDTSLYYYALRQQLADSILNQDNTRKLTRLHMQYEFDKKEEQYQHQQEVHALNMQRELLLHQLSRNALEKSRQDQKIQAAELSNQKLQTSESLQQLRLATQEKTLAQAENKGLQQENELSALRLRQFWLFAFIGLLALGLLFLGWWNKNRVKQLKMKNTLKEKEALELLQKNKITESELKAIRSQMNPHFIFNVLNSIEAYIVESDPEMARVLVQKFAKLSRMILENSTQTLCSLQSEWKINRLYTEIEHIRFGGHFEYRFENVRNTDLDLYLIPPMMLQPLVENAILHGLRRERRADGLLTVLLDETGEYIEITVTDNGAGPGGEKMPVPGYKKKSFGLASVKDRIRILNETHPGAVASFELEDRALSAEKGCRVVLRLPKIMLR